MSSLVIKLSEECSAAILNTSPIKKDLGCQLSTARSETNILIMHYETSEQVSVSVMTKDAFNKLKHSRLVPISTCLQLADQSVLYPAGVAENILVKIRDFFVP